jgi:hypothetical protein
MKQNGKKYEYPNCGKENLKIDIKKLLNKGDPVFRNLLK